MIRKLFSTLAGILLTAVSVSWVGATPSTTYWTPDTSDIQPYGVWHITYDTYFTKDSAFPMDYGITVGVLPFEKFQMEVGYDLLEPVGSDEWLEDGSYFNFKFGTPEEKLFEGSPAWNAGMFNIGVSSGKTDYDIGQVILGKTLPANLGRIHVGGYFGITDTLERTASSGDGDRAGFMVAYDKFIWKDKVMFAADYAWGENAIGGGGAGLYYFFNPSISLLTGPVWFNDEDLNGNWKWTVQLDINFKF